MWSWLLKLFDPLGQIARELERAYEAKLRAQNDRERIAAEVRIKTLEAQRDILVAEQRSRLTRWIRPAFAFPFVVYNFKVIVWDKVLGLGATDPLSEEFWWLQTAIFGAYFLTRPIEKWRR